MSLLGFIALPGELLVALLLCVAILAVAVALQATRTLKRTRRAAKRLAEHMDPVSGIPSRSGLFRDLRILAGESQRTGTHLLAVFELLELPAYELDHGTQAADELLRSLATRLENAVGRAGGAYSLGRGRFGVLARIGRVS